MKNTLAEFYDGVATLAEQKKKCPRSLEEFLRAVYALIRRHDRGIMTYSILLDVYRRSFDSEPCTFDETWMNATAPPEITPEEDDAKDLALQTLAFLVADLRRMERAGILSEDPTILYGGVDSPSGNRWYNFDPSTFIECGARGALDHVGDEGEREIAAISWGEVASIIELGRIYE
jgi:hypothetical protein